MHSTARRGVPHLANRPQNAPIVRHRRRRKGGPRGRTVISCGTARRLRAQDPLKRRPATPRKELVGRGGRSMPPNFPLANVLSAEGPEGGQTAFVGEYAWISAGGGNFSLSLCLPTGPHGKRSSFYGEKWFLCGVFLVHGCARLGGVGSCRRCWKHWCGAVYLVTDDGIL